PKISIKYLRNGEEHLTYATAIKESTKWYERKSLRQILIGPGEKAIIYNVLTNSPAALAGLKKGDEVVAMNGEKIHSFVAVVAAEESMTNGQVKPLVLTVRRGGEQFERSLEP